jgi:hypothetical protein
LTPLPISELLSTIALVVLSGIVIVPVESIAKLSGCAAIPATAPSCSAPGRL